MNENILIVDDEKEIADLIEVYLKNDGYIVHKFYNGIDALECIKSQKMDLAILDVMLPDVDGFHICQKIREQYFYPIIMLTAKVEGRKNAEEWKLIWGYDGLLCSFGYHKIDYRLFTYAQSPGCPDIGEKIKIKKALCFKLRFTNDFFNQPFILREYGLDYVSEN